MTRLGLKCPASCVLLSGTIRKRGTGRPWSSRSLITMRPDQLPEDVEVLDISNPELFEIATRLATQTASRRIAAFAEPWAWLTDAEARLVVKTAQAIKEGQAAISAAPQAGLL